MAPTWGCGLTLRDYTHPASFIALPTATPAALVTQCPSARSQLTASLQTKLFKRGRSKRARVINAGIALEIWTAKEERVAEANGSEAVEKRKEMYLLYCMYISTSHGFCHLSVI